MSKLLSTHYSDGAFNFGTLVLRLAMAGLLVFKGFNKLTHFAEVKKHFGSYFGMPSSLSLSLVVFAEFFCAIFVILGLGTRIAAIPIIISFCVATFKAHNGAILGDGQAAFMYLIGFFVILILGPGKISVDGAIGK